MTCFKVDELISFLVKFPDIPVMVKVGDKLHPMKLDSWEWNQVEEKVVFKWEDY